MFMRQAARIAINRTVAGVHFPVDSGAGALLGLTLGGYFIVRSLGRDPASGWRFVASKFDATHDFDWSRLYDVSTRLQTEQDWAVETPAAAPANANAIQSAPLAWLWSKAEAEWRDL
jgi:hypothetical protein